jgi:hypothetical protein
VVRNSQTRRAFLLFSEGDEHTVRIYTCRFISIV